MNKQQRIRQSVHHTELNILSGQPFQRQTPQSNLNGEYESGMFLVYSADTEGNPTISGNSGVYNGQLITGTNLDASGYLPVNPDPSMPPYDVKLITADVNGALIIGNYYPCIRVGYDEVNQIMYYCTLFKDILLYESSDITVLITAPAPAPPGGLSSQINFDYPGQYQIMLQIGGQVLSTGPPYSGDNLFYWYLWDNTNMALLAGNFPVYETSIPNLAYACASMVGTVGAVPWRPTQIVYNYTFTIPLQTPGIQMQLIVGSDVGCPVGDQWTVNSHIEALRIY